jgi:threonine/homoserine/homoserine lactone efflux protein
MGNQVLDAIWKGILIGLFMAISVGPTLFAVIKYSLHNSYKAGLAFVLGVSLSDIMYVTLANLAAPLLLALNAYASYIAYGGGALLAVMGLAGLLKKDSGGAPPAGPVTISGGQYLRIWLSGFLINTVNPGVIVSWLAAVTATSGKGGGYRFLHFSVCLILILSIDFLKVFLASRIKRLLTPARVVYLQKISSFILFVLGLLLVYKTWAA